MSEYHPEPDDDDDDGGYAEFIESGEDFYVCERCWGTYLEDNFSGQACVNCDGRGFVIK